MGGRQFLAGGSALAAICLIATPAEAQTAQRYDIAEQDLAAALKSFATVSGREVLAASTLVVRKRSVAVRGDYRPEEALKILLSQAGLRADVVEGAFVIRPLDIVDRGTPQEDPAKVDIVVTGSRIRGAPVASPVIALTRETIRNAGQATLPEALRTLPQNFGGGQNPGIGFNVPEASGADLGGGASINLRGLGSDATLTLLNGHRLSYNSAKQSVDISGIPLGAISRLDVVPDGASALFGSDAVAGVVNIVLRRDLNGIGASALLAGSTDGGNFDKLFGLTAGKSWRAGNLLLSYEYGSNTAITATQRDYAANRSPGLTLFPAISRHSAVASFNQNLTDTLAFSLDGLFNKRRTDLTFPLDFGGDLAVSRGHNSSVAQSFGLAPSLKLSLAHDWLIALTGSFGQDKVDYAGEYFFGTTRIDGGSGYYRNREQSIELSGTGRLFALPGGPAKIAIGTGYRRIDFVRFAGTGGTQNIDRSQSDAYAFGELSLPLIARAQGVRLVDSLTVSAAARYENYRGVGTVATPKIGIVYAPTPDLALKASWGKSFRAPTLYQQYQPQGVYLTQATTVGGQGYPATATALLLIGGNPALKPERSTNWSATLDLHPRSLAGFGIEISYFSVDYRDRIVTPIPSFSAALRSPIYANFVTVNPGAAAQSALIAGAGTFTNISGSSIYDPLQVVALVNNSSVNAGRQSVRGLDVLAHYSGAMGGGTLLASLDGAYLKSRQQIAPTYPVTRLAGIIFNPPHVRARGELGWSINAFTLTGDVTYIGSVEDDRTTPTVRVRGMTPIDFTLRYKVAKGPIGGLDIVASIQNAFNVKPAPIATTLYYDTPYDSTNYSPVGRYVSLSVTTRW